MAIGQASSFAPDAAKAQKSAEEIFTLLDSEPTTQVDDASADKVKPNEVNIWDFLR